MSDRSHTLKKLNFANWLVMYQYLKENQALKNGRVLLYPPLDPDKGIELDIVEIKAYAFDELLELFPSHNTLDMLVEITHEVYKQNREIQPLYFFLEKLKNILP